jgi:hypothetical protein
MIKLNEEMIRGLSKKMVEDIARDIVSVQPMPANTIADLYKSSMSEKDLREAGYVPVCENTRLMWIKKGSE